LTKAFIKDYADLPDFLIFSICEIFDKSLCQAHYLSKSLNFTRSCVKNLHRKTLLTQPRQPQNSLPKI
jgi:hypothetical protein